eukprot:2867188-Heterocapsa_arctica.AAC.1
MDTEFELGLLFDDKHEHQKVKGSNKFGPRSIQKDTLPEGVTDDRAWRSLGRNSRPKGCGWRPPKRDS